MMSERQRQDEQQHNGNRARRRVIRRLTLTRWAPDSPRAARPRLRLAVAPLAISMRFLWYH